MLLLYTIHLPRVSQCGMRPRLLMAVSAWSQIKAPLGGLKGRIEVKGRPTIATHSCCSLLKQYQGWGNDLVAPYSPATGVTVRHKVQVVHGRFGLEPNLTPNLEG